MSVPSFTVVIPARLASTRLPNKPLADIGGHPMIVRVAERAHASSARRTVVATDAQQVADACAPHNVEVVLTRTSHPSGTDRLAEVAARLGLADDDIVVNVQGDEPLIDPNLIDEVAIHLAAHPDCAIATAAHPLHDFRPLGEVSLHPRWREPRQIPRRPGAGVHRRVRHPPRHEEKGPRGRAPYAPRS